MKKIYVYYIVHFVYCINKRVMNYKYIRRFNELICCNSLSESRSF